MMNTNPVKGYTFFLIIALIIFGLVGYLGFRTIEHQVLLNHYQVEERAKNQLSKVEQFIEQVLAKKATRLDAVADFMQLSDESIEQFITTDSDVNNLFVLRNNQLVFPTKKSLSSQSFRDEIEPVIEDTNLLYAPSISDETTRPNKGWYINYNHQIPLLIYWYKRDDLVIGFSLSYVHLLADVVNTANFNDTQANVKVFESDRLLYESQAKELPLLASRNLNYPLTQWQIAYYSQPASGVSIYLWGIVIITLMLACIGFIMFSLYREYSKTTRQALQQVNFVSQVSHELKTPLTNITLYAELLREELEDDYPEQQAYADIIVNESQRLSRLIRNILTFTKTSKIQLIQFDLSQALVQVAQTFTPSFEGKGIDLVLSIPENISVVSDVDRVTQIICNFISNSEKYAAQGKRVDLSLKPSSEFVDIEVRDYGEGIANKEHKLIFMPFYRIKSSITEGVAGTGIGLTIAKQLASALNAEIRVTNTQPGVCFTLRLWRTEQVT